MKEEGNRSQSGGEESRLSRIQKNGTSIWTRERGPRSFQGATTVTRDRVGQIEEEPRGAKAIDAKRSNSQSAMGAAA